MSEIAILGTVNYDRVILPDGSSHQGLGGILYNLLTLAPFLGEGETVRPVARVGAERRRQVERYAEPYGCVDMSGMLWDEAGTNETVLTYRSADERDEALVERAAPLTWEEIERAASADRLLVNMISGKELSRDLFRKLAAAASGPVVFDVQSLTLTFGRKPKRRYQPVPRWREWLENVETVKGNEAEMRAMAGDDDEPFRGELAELAERCLDAGPEAVIVTRGTVGHLAAWREGRRVRCREMGAAKLPEGSLRDTTGCGDAFTSGYLLGRLRGEDPFEASLLGASLAAAACTTTGLGELRRLGDPALFREEHFRGEGGGSGPGAPRRSG
jgi:sugar/nucleoside kinase (ribokinase family)